MNKFILVLGCSCFAVLVASGFAEGSPLGALPSLGVEGGINLADLNGPNVNDAVGSRLGFVGGGFLNLPLTPGLALQPEVLYEQKGGKINGNGYQLDYLEVPVLLDVTFGIPLLDPGILLGPSFNSNVFNSGLNNVNQTDVGLVAGVQLHFANILLSGRYEIGLTDVSSDQKIQNGTFTFLLGFSIL